MDELKEKIREVPDFPKPGILFYDVTTLLKDPDGLRQIIQILTDRYRGLGIEKVLGIESRGFILAPPVACNIGAGFVPVRKQGKLPSETLSLTYDLEYGQDSLEIHRDAIQDGQKVLIVDDLIATGGTAAATSKMAKQLGADVVELAFLVELEALQGRQKLDGFGVYSILKY